MPIVNGNGSLIQERTKTKEEIYISALKFPSDAFLLLRLTKRQFKMWIYGLDPREAMITACNPTFKLLSDMKLNKWRFIWKLLWE